jgi:collagenase-like PrtC family protease
MRSGADGRHGERPPILEFFIHGALCVAFSGQCYISHAHTGRSANRGECSQACRLPYTLVDGQGKIVAFDKHLLSMKDNDQSANLRALAEAGIRSFKIEGRLKDLAYVKNITAHYRQLLDRIIADAPSYARASSGRSTFSFTPQPGEDLQPRRHRLLRERPPGRHRRLRLAQASPARRAAS